MNNYIDVYIHRKYDEYLTDENIDNIKNFSLFYNNILFPELANIFGYFHNKLNELFKF